jgi:L-ascorbate metabolism protein UlaG (beta-lactamase superfamily)
MKLTKFEHSCVLIEDTENDINILVDPGIFAWQSGNVDVAKLPQLNYIVVTHLHGDHLAEPFVRALVERSPDVQWIAPSDAQESLKGFGVTKVTNQSLDKLEVSEAEHAKVIPFGVACNNLRVDYDNKLTIVGDTHDISDTKDILLLPVQAPWGTTVEGLELGLKLKPKYILPVHDWMWRDEWKANVYDRFEAVLAEQDTKFIKAVNGQQIEINL